MSSFKVNGFLALLTSQKMSVVKHYLVTPSFQFNSHLFALVNFLCFHHYFPKLAFLQFSELISLNRIYNYNIKKYGPPYPLPFEF